MTQSGFDRLVAFFRTNFCEVIEDKIVLGLYRHLIDVGNFKYETFCEMARDIEADVVATFESSVTKLKQDADEGGDDAFIRICYN